MTGMGRHILFKCPGTGMNVQHWLDEAAGEKAGSAYKSVDCPACTLVHFVHWKTGKLLGESVEGPR
jgi:hypothetical protein